MSAEPSPGWSGVGVVQASTAEVRLGARDGTPGPSGASARRIVCLTNARSGRGRGSVVGQRFAQALQSSGHRVVSLDVSEAAGGLSDALKDADLLVVFGGDGTVHHSLPDLIDSGVPFYHVGQGTENLLTREFGMGRRLADLERAIDAWRVRAVDVGEWNGRPFAIMASVGPDASVLHRLHASRTGRISHLSYAAPILRELLQPNIPRLVVEVDGRRVVDGQPGLLLVACSAEYATRLNLAAGARVDDGLLDVVFLRGRTSVGMTLWAPRAWMRRLERSKGCVVARGAEVRIDEVGGAVGGASRSFLQVDGEAMMAPSTRGPSEPTPEETPAAQAGAGTGHAGAAVASSARPPYLIRVRAGVLRVLCPPAGTGTWRDDGASDVRGTSPTPD